MVPGCRSGGLFIARRQVLALDVQGEQAAAQADAEGHQAPTKESATDERDATRRMGDGAKYMKRGRP